jgi:hypothetical protein
MFELLYLRMNKGPPHGAIDKKKKKKKKNPLSRRRQWYCGRTLGEGPHREDSAHLHGGTANDDGPIIGTECT